MIDPILGGFAALAANRLAAVNRTQNVKVITAANASEAIAQHSYVTRLLDSGKYYLVNVDYLSEGGKTWTLEPV